MIPMNLRVTYYHRRPEGTNFSIERLFADIRQALPNGLTAKVAVSRFPSRGFFRRFYNIFEAAFRQNAVNHITGDVHFLAFLLRKRNTLLTICDLVTLHRLHGLRRVVFFFLWYWLPIKRVALISVISESTKRELIYHCNVDPGKVRVVYCPVSDSFQPVPKPFNYIKPIILQIGTGLNKNVERVAMALEGIPCHFRVIGKLNNEQISVLQQHRIEFSSSANISDEAVVEEYRRCDMLVFVSTYEGFGLPIVEAQATGRPVVTSNIFSMPEVAGSAAFLADPLNIASIREGVRKVIEDTAYRDSLIQLGFENVVRFHSAKIAKQYVALYQELQSQ